MSKHPADPVRLVSPPHPLARWPRFVRWPLALVGRLMLWGVAKFVTFVFSRAGG